MPKRKTEGYAFLSVYPQLLGISQYGTVDNYLACHDRGIQRHMPDLKKRLDATSRRKDIFPEEAFGYDPETDTYRCPGNQVLKRRRQKKKRKAFEYGATTRTCMRCPLRDQCTKSKTGRTVKRHLRQDDLNHMRQNAQSPRAKKDIKKRQSLMERSFARATRYGFKRARWRRIGRVRIQEYLTAAVQNIMVLLRHAKDQRPVQGVNIATLKQGVLCLNQGISFVHRLIMFPRIASLQLF